MSLFAAVSSVLRQYANFSGRARRSEYWWYTLAYGVVAAAVTIAFPSSSPDTAAIGTVISALLSLALLLPTLGVAVRRLHDTDHSGLWLFIGFVPLIGAIWMIVLLATDGTPGRNRFGANPKAATRPVRQPVGV